jgi:hypothetical protein
MLRARAAKVRSQAPAGPVPFEEAIRRARASLGAAKASPAPAVQKDHGPAPAKASPAPAGHQNPTPAPARKPEGHGASEAARRILEGLRPKTPTPKPEARQLVIGGEAASDRSAECDVGAGVVLRYDPSPGPRDLIVLDDRDRPSAAHYGADVAAKIYEGWQREGLIAADAPAYADVPEGPDLPQWFEASPFDVEIDLPPPAKAAPEPAREPEAPRRARAAATPRPDAPSPKPQRDRPSPAVKIPDEVLADVRRRLGGGFADELQRSAAQIAAIVGGRWSLIGQAIDRTLTGGWGRSAQPREGVENRFGYFIACLQTLANSEPPVLSEAALLRRRDRKGTR